jgi:hypothetical protein
MDRNMPLNSQTCNSVQLAMCRSAASKWNVVFGSRSLVTRVDMEVVMRFEIHTVPGVVKGQIR